MTRIPNYALELIRIFKIGIDIIKYMKEQILQQFEEAFLFQRNRFQQYMVSRCSITNCLYIKRRLNRRREKNQRLDGIQQLNVDKEHNVLFFITQFSIAYANIKIQGGILYLNYIYPQLNNKIGSQSKCLAMSQYYEQMNQFQ
ncbi:unnamed protein product [Paramecium sonneborni]|uniref:Uncharacterized protein n=1 Tax=Paramecium sonneborni TaxID=65129 RepID=A0A8S1R311_9CILI|nr:unnamed protein product [Paramecium sonneborni]